jgi:transcriptional regulator with XRE-family HTH domain
MWSNQRIKGLRNKMGLTQREFSGLLDIDVSHLSKWERAVDPITPQKRYRKQLDKIEELFDVEDIRTPAGHVRYGLIRGRLWDEVERPRQVELERAKVAPEAVLGVLRDAGVKDPLEFLSALEIVARRLKSMVAQNV